MSSPSSKRRTPQAIAAIVLVLVTFTGTTPATGATTIDAMRASWLWPVAAPHPVVRPFIAPESRYSRGHRGIDVAANQGAIVRSPADGIVHYSGHVVDRPLISLRHGDGLISSFEPVLSTLAAGITVHRGQPLGTLQSGHCGVPCLHIGVRLHGEYISPLNYLSGIPRSVLLPTREIQ